MLSSDLRAAVSARRIWGDVLNNLCDEFRDGAEIDRVSFRGF